MIGKDLTFGTSCRLLHEPPVLPTHRAVSNEHWGCSCFSEWVSHCRWQHLWRTALEGAISKSNIEIVGLQLICMFVPFCPNMSRPHPLCLFSEVASRLSSSGVPSRDFYRNFCSACSLHSISCHFWTLRLFFLLTLLYVQVVMIARDCWSDGESYKFSAGSESVELLPAFAGGVVLASLLSVFAMLVMTPGTYNQSVNLYGAEAQCF